jgi:hypothetical protein
LNGGKYRGSFGQSVQWSKATGKISRAVEAFRPNFRTNGGCNEGVRVRVLQRPFDFQKIEYMNGVNIVTDSSWALTWVIVKTEE